MDAASEGFAPHFRKSPVTDPWEPLFSRARDGVVELLFEVRSAHCNTRGLLHGGVLAALSDNAMGLSLALASGDASPQIVTLNLTLDYLGSARLGERVLITPRVLRTGGSVGFCDALVQGGQAGSEALIARASASFRVRTTAMTPRGQAVPTRERIVHAAKRLFQERGYHAVGTAAILAEAHAPKGSMYHHFPGGKEAIAVAVVEAIRADVTSALLNLDARGVSAAAALRQLACQLADWVEASRWQGTMLASLAVGCAPELPALHDVLRGAVDEWRARWVGLLMREGWSERRARGRAQLLLASLEGAMILARIERDGGIVLAVGEQLARELDAPARPTSGLRRGR